VQKPTQIFEAHCCGAVQVSPRGSLTAIWHVEVARSQTKPSQQPAVFVQCRQRQVAQAAELVVQLPLRGQQKGASLGQHMPGTVAPQSIGAIGGQ
jgi:hypothetical protein